MIALNLVWSRFIITVQICFLAQESCDMKLSEMKTQCRKCGKELRADSKDSDFVTFYCMVCGIYTSRPVEEFADKKEETPTVQPVEGANQKSAGPAPLKKE
jgi:hypothetical protein